MAAPPGGLAILVDEKRVNELLQQTPGQKNSGWNGFAKIQEITWNKN
jgi:hypothetical protein